MTQLSTRRRPQRPTSSTRRSAGFTLIELLIAVAVIGILASIAYPSYQRYVMESRRTDAKSALMQTASQLERCYTVTSDYRYRNGDGTDCVNFTDKISDERFYFITASGGDGNQPGASGYTLVATARQDEAQFRDEKCRKFELSNTGVRSSESAAGSNTTSECW